MSNVLSEAIRLNKEQSKKTLHILIAEAEGVRRDRDRVRAMLGLFDNAGFDAFRESYLLKIRIPQLYEASAKSLAADEKTRMVMAGQIAEAEAMASSKIVLESDLGGLTQTLNVLDVRIAKERKRSTKELEGDK